MKKLFFALGKSLHVINFNNLAIFQVLTLKMATDRKGNFSVDKFFLMKKK